MTGQQGPNEFYVGLVQQQLDRRFSDMTRELDRRFDEVNRRFTTQDKAIEDINRKIDKIEDSPKDTFRAYATPIIVAVFTAIIIAILVKQGVVTSS